MASGRMRVSALICNSLANEKSGVSALSQKSVLTIDWREQQTKIAIADPESGDWQYLTFPTWNEARGAINEAREQGKQASSLL